MTSLIGQVFSSTDPGAPQLSGVVGSLATVLDAILVDGYGTGEARREGLGWSRVSTAPNVRVYRNDPVLANGIFFRVDDSGSGAAGAREALLRGYVEWDSGVGALPFPTLAQLASGVVWNKSRTSNDLVRDWVAFGNAATLYLFTSWDGSRLVPWFMGDIASFSPVDRLATMVGGLAVEGQTTAFLSRVLNQLKDMGATVGVSSSPHIFVASSSPQNPVSTGAEFAKSALRNNLAINNNYGNNVGGARIYPGAISGGADLERCIISIGAFLERGFAPGCYAPLHDRPFPHLSTHPGLGPNGGDLVAISYNTHSSGGVTEGQVLFEIGVSW